VCGGFFAKIEFDGVKNLSISDSYSRPLITSLDSNVGGFEFYIFSILFFDFIILSILGFSGEIIFSPFPNEININNCYTSNYIINGLSTVGISIGNIPTLNNGTLNSINFYFNNQTLIPYPAIGSAYPQYFGMITGLNCFDLNSTISGFNQTIWVFF
jgi:hypothetical protein